jgi:threonine aldolase
MAQILAEKLERIPGVKITHKVQSNAVFAIFPPRCIEKLKSKFYFHVWNENISEVRLMTTFDTTEEDIVFFVETVGEIMIG